jgi:hypothetical protein
VEAPEEVVDGRLGVLAEDAEERGVVGLVLGHGLLERSQLLLGLGQEARERAPERLLVPGLLELLLDYGQALGQGLHRGRDGRDPLLRGGLGVPQVVREADRAGVGLEQHVGDVIHQAVLAALGRRHVHDLPRFWVWRSGAE